MRSSTIRAVIFILSLSLSLAIGMTSIHATVANEKIKAQPALDLSWLPVILLYLVIFCSIAIYGKVGCLITTSIIAMTFLFTGQYIAGLLCALLIVAIVFSDSGSGGDHNPDDYNDVG